MERRNFLKMVGGSLVTLPALGALANPTNTFKSNGIPVLVDADTANEVDDLYAIVRALLEPDFDIVGLTSAQWFHHLSPQNTVVESQKLNEDILRLMNRTDIPSPMGSDMIVGKPWGGTEPSDSEAAQIMISIANSMPANKKLVIAVLGALTNVASAIQLAPEIIPKISVYCLSAKYSEKDKIWDKDEFNARRDLNALNVALNTEGLDFHLMPVNILYDFKFKQVEVRDKLDGKGGIWDYLVSRWISHSPESTSRIFWDLALIEAIAYPKFAKEKSVYTPPENTQRKINVYTYIDIEKMQADWWKVVGKAL